MQPKVSMVVSCYNKVDYISEMLDSVLTQKWDNLQIILVNDGSNDGTRDVISQYESKLQARGYEVIIIDQDNQGVAAAVRNGLMRVTGELVCIPDCDDVLHEEYVSAMANALRLFPDVNCVVCDQVRNRWDTDYITEADSSEAILVLNPDQSLLTKYLMKKLSASVAVIMLRAELINKLRLKERFIINLSHTQEEQIWIPILATENAILYLRKSLYTYVQRENSIVTSPTEMLAIEQYAETRCLLSQNTLAYYIQSPEKRAYYDKLIHMNKYEVLIRRIRRNPHLKSYEKPNIHLYIQAVNDSGLLPCTLEEEFVDRVGFSPTFYAATNYIIRYYPVKKGALTAIRKREGRLIAYGAGLAMRSNLEDFIKCTIVPDIIWDVKAQAGDSLFGVPLETPDFTSLSKKDTVIIFLYGNQDVEHRLRETEANVFYFQDVLNDLSAKHYPELMMNS